MSTEIEDSNIKNAYEISNSSRISRKYELKEAEKNYIEELKLIQDIIKRMAANSFSLKGWAVTLVVATLLMKIDTRVGQSSLAFLPLAVFWYLDAYYLRKERLYRKLFDWVRINRLFCTDCFFDLSTNRFEKEVKSTVRIMFSTSELPFYMGIAVLIILFIEFFQGAVTPSINSWFLMDGFCLWHK